MKIRSMFLVAVLVLTGWTNSLYAEDTYTSKIKYYDLKRNDTRGMGEQFATVIEQNVPPNEQKYWNEVIRNINGDLVKWNFKPSSMSFVWVDLNNNKVEDVIMQLEHISFCGHTYGCPVYILINEEGKLRQVGEFETHESIGIGMPVVDGYVSVYDGNGRLGWSKR